MTIRRYLIAIAPHIEGLGLLFMGTALGDDTKGVSADCASTHATRPSCACPTSCIHDPRLRTHGDYPRPSGYTAPRGLSHGGHVDPRIPQLQPFARFGGEKQISRRRRPVHLCTLHYSALLTLTCTRTTNSPQPTHSSWSSSPAHNHKVASRQTKETAGSPIWLSTRRSRASEGFIIGSCVGHSGDVKDYSYR